MSDKDHFLARWSRRRAEVEAAEEQHESTASNPPAEQEDTAEPALAADAAEESSDAPLPAIEELTAESDITAFFRKGVPEALRSAALRRVWSLDPAIRDYVGPAEYAWDFNQPGSMAGFGPADVLGPAGEIASEQVSRTLGTVAELTGPSGTASPAIPAATSQVSVATSSEDLSSGMSQRAGAAPPPAEHAVEWKAAQPEGMAAAGPETARRRHGSALPR